LTSLEYPNGVIDDDTLTDLLRGAGIVSLPEHSLEMLTDESAAVEPPDQGAKYVLEHFCAAHNGAMLISEGDIPQELQVGDEVFPTQPGALYVNEHFRFIVNESA